MTQPIRRCLQCGNYRGTPEGNSDSWYDRVVRYGKIGLFCSMPCVNLWTFEGDARFTIEEVNRLLSVADRAKNQPS